MGGLNFFIIIILLICSNVKYSDQKVLLEVEDDESQLAKMLSEIVNQHFVGYFATLNIILPQNSSNSLLLKDVTASIITQIMSHNSFIAFRCEKITKTVRSNRPKRGAICLFEKFEDFQNLLKFIENGIFWVHGRYVLVLLEGELPEIDDFFKLSWEHQVYNIIIIFKLNNGTIQVRTYFPFHENSCHDTNSIVINEFKRGNFTKNPDNIFSSKIGNLFGCKLRIATSNNSVPFIFAHKLENETYHLSGRDIKMLNVLSQALNFKIDYVFIGDEGYLLENGTASGPFQLLLDKKADLIAADYWLKVNRLQYIDYTTSYINQYVAFVIPPGAEYTAFEKFFRPLDIYTWICFFVTVIIGFFLIFVLNKNAKRYSEFVFGVGVEEPYLNILIAIVGGSQTTLPFGNFARFILMMFLIFCLVIRTVYTGGLFDSLQQEAFHKEAQSIDEMIQKDYKFYAISTILDLIEGQSRIYERLFDE
jgi:hypothetical protein